MFDVHPILINEYGILVAEAEDKSKTYWFGIYDFANIIDQINLIELIENQLNKQIEKKYNYINRITIIRIFLFSSWNQHR